MATSVIMGFFLLFSTMGTAPASSELQLYSLVDTDNDGLMDHIEDPDMDGILDPGETDPMDDDTDNDGLLDGIEDLNQNGVLNFLETDPRLTDSDTDGLQDGTEKGLFVPQGLHTDMNIFIPDAEPSSKTDPLDSDTDNDGRLDGIEDNDHNGFAAVHTSQVLNGTTDADRYV